jgi:RNA-directed DNA polymerase
MITPAAFMRYADDFVVTCKTLSQAEKALDLVKYILTQDLFLELNPQKTKIARLYDGFQFLDSQTNPLHEIQTYLTCG